MAHRGLTASQPWMRADPHAGPELRLHPEAEYIDAALTFVSLPTSSCDARPDHTFGTSRKYGERSQWRVEQTFIGAVQCYTFGPMWTIRWMRRVGMPRNAGETAHPKSCLLRRRTRLYDLLF
jgi:hypothetical protein